MGDGTIERRAHLHLVDDGAEYSTAESSPESNGDPGPVPESSDTAQNASAVIGTAVAHAAMSWVACCMERLGQSVTVATLGGGVFDADVLLVDGGNVMVRVTLILEHGPRLRTLVEPIHP